MQYPKYVFTITRKDLDMSYAAVQAGHALYESASEFYNNKINKHPHFVLCQVKNENKLLYWISKLESENIQFVIWKEPDLNNQITAISTEILTNDKIKIFKKLKLLGK